MFSHLFVAVTNFERALAFHSAVMDALGHELRFCEPEKPWAGWHGPRKSRSFFVIGRPYNGNPQHPGNGQMVAFTAASRAVVDQFHQTALAHGGTCEGPPGLRAHYHPNYYGAYYRDPDGNKFGVACHLPLSDPWMRTPEDRKIVAAFCLTDQSPLGLVPMRRSTSATSRRSAASSSLSMNG